jgi:APA family basic amino acid/polyamine antiporter
MSKHKIGFYTAISIVIANMVGTGVFTSLGFQVTGIQDGFSLLALWITGGVLALCGALVYAEIGAALPENGGEFHYLSKLYHPSLGFLSGWVSVTVGFAAPIAAASMALGKYLYSANPVLPPTLSAIVVIALITFIHSINLKTGGVFQQVFTLIKIAVIGVFITAGIFCEPLGTVNFLPNENSFSQITSASFAASLIYVTYAYSGWNAAAYLSADLKNVNKTLPRALFFGTLLVLIIYTLLNFVFLRSTPLEALKGQIEIGHLSAANIFGVKAGHYMSLAIAVLLISTISAMVLAGPRVMQSMGQKYTSFKLFAITNKNEVPYVAIIFQSLIAVSLVLFSSFESLINYVGFTLNLFTLLTVFGIFILRFKFKKIALPFKSPFFPIPAILFLSIIIWILYNMLIEKPVESVLGLTTVSAGLLFYYITNKHEKKNEIV